MFEELTKFSEEYKQAKKDYNNKVKPLFKEALKEIFTKHPTLKAYRWEQFTPYFNDGEPCEFRVYDITHFCKSDKLEEGEEWNYSSDDESLDKDLRTLENFLQENAEVLRELYEDGVQITVTRSKVTVEEYEHD